MRTRKEGKGYLRRDFGGQPGADSLDALELADTAERAERIAVCNDAGCQSRPDAAERLDFHRGSDVEVDYCGS